MDDDAVEREYPYRGRAPLLVLLVSWGVALGSLAWAVIDHGPFRGRDGLVTVGETPASAFRWSVFVLCVALAVFVTRWTWIDRVRAAGSP